MKKLFYPLVLLLVACGTPTSDQVVEVDPMIGTGLHGHTYPGATVPFGMVQLSPDTRANNWDACSGYYYDDNTLDGFSHTHLSGTGCADLGDLLVYPTLNDTLPCDSLIHLRPIPFSHDDEKAACGYYAVNLRQNGIEVELTATKRTGVHRYTFTGKGTPRLILDLRHTISDERIYQHTLHQTDTAEICGMRRTQGWTPNHTVCFAARFSVRPTKIELLNDWQAVVSFAPDTKSVTLAVGLSGVSEENARLNLQAEVPALDFDAVRIAATDSWRQVLGRITLTGGSKEARKTFYTALYHTALTPNLMSDVNGQYRRNDQSIGQLAKGEAYYSTLSLWDTFRAWIPLQTLTDTTLVNNIVRSMLDMYDATGELPIWPLASGETRTMIGYHAVAVIADAYLKGIRGYDAEKALAAMIRSSNINPNGSDYYTANGFIPANIRRESVSTTLEYAYDDWTIARMAGTMNKPEIEQEYLQRAANYINVFDGESGFFRGHNDDGSWTTPFDPTATGRDYTEAAAWQYRFFVPHDVNGLEQLLGGREAFVKALDELFTLKGDTKKIAVADVSGLVGQYAHGNEPSHHMAYLYDYVGQPWKTQEMTRRLLDEMYAPTPEGIIGNEDCGQMSAWYVFTALGLYPVCPGSNEFALTTPLFGKAEIRLANGRQLTLLANNPERNRYIASVTLNGKPILENFITYDQLMAGGTLQYKLVAKPDTRRGTQTGAAPYSLTRGDRVSIPYIRQSLALFTEPVEVEIASNTAGAEIHYTMDGSQPDSLSPLYTAPIRIDCSLTLKARGYKTGHAPSTTMTVKAEKALFAKPVPAQASQNGVRYTCYTGRFTRVDEIRKGQLHDSGVMPVPSIAKAPQADHFGYVFEGVIRIPKRGIWAFMTKSDDGSVLWIDGRKVVDNDASHAAISATGRVALEAGLHTFRLLYFEDYEGEALEWGWKAPDTSDFTDIPSQNLYIR